ncbi:MAG TPA: flavodoxin family protein, partial [Erysipelotrichaceae bacterium]|nr:flavodoxin family protein [Erysipelotrichaceae bacterium]
MQTLLINGSPHPNGCTFTALSLVAGELEKAGIETEIVQIGTKDIRGCIGCR